MSASTQEPENPSIPGYDYGRSTVPPSPVSLEELRQLENAVGWTEEDFQILRHHAGIFKRHAEQMVDAWRALIASQIDLVKWFAGPDGKPDDEYRAKVKMRFVQWVIDVCTRPHDQAWLDYQEEIGLRHTPQKKNVTDQAHTQPLVPLRYLIAFVPATVPAVRKFFVEGDVRGRNYKNWRTLGSRRYSFTSLCGPGLIASMDSGNRGRVRLR